MKMKLATLTYLLSFSFIFCEAKPMFSHYPRTFVDVPKSLVFYRPALVYHDEETSWKSMVRFQSYKFWLLLMWLLWKFILFDTLKVNRYYCRHFSVAVSFSKISFRNSGYFHNIMNTFKVWKSNNTDFVEQLK